MNAPLTISGWMRYDVVRRHIEDLAPSSILEQVSVHGLSAAVTTTAWNQTTRADVKRSSGCPATT